MAAGRSSRFYSYSQKKHKAFLEVKNEILIERQIKQLQEAGIKEIVIVTGYLKEQFDYLKEKYNVTLIENKEYLTKNNGSSIYAARSYIRNSYICSCDNYFNINPFESLVDNSYYSVVYSPGHTDEWCVQVDEQGDICNVTIGGLGQWYMMGHVFWAKPFSETFIEILEKNYESPIVRDSVWERLLSLNLDKLKIKIRKYDKKDILEFDTQDDFDKLPDSNKWH